MFLPMFFVCVTAVANPAQTNCNFVYSNVVRSEQMCHSVMQTQNEFLAEYKQKEPSLTWTGKCLELKNSKEV